MGRAGRSALTQRLRGPRHNSPHRFSPHAHSSERWLHPFGQWPHLQLFVFLVGPGANTGLPSACSALACIDGAVTSVVFPRNVDNGVRVPISLGYDLQELINWADSLIS